MVMFVGVELVDFLAALESVSSCSSCQSAFGINAFYVDND